ncbi:MAG TPA: hypothetical protein VII11_10365 [Bacteroidota bacterium]
MLKKIFMIAALVSTCAATSFAQAMDVQGGNQVLSITTAVAGSEPTAVVNTSTTLRYRRTFDIIKITVATSCPSQQFTLKALATSVTSGTAAPEVTLTNGMPATNFVTSIPFGFFTYSTCTVRYTASATFAQGNSAEFGNDVHTVTYTLVGQ